MAELGHYSLLLALAAAVWSVVAAALGVVSRGRGLQRSAEHALIAATGLTLLSAACLVHGFLTDDFRLDYVYHYSSTSQALPYKVGALWGGQAGSLLLWLLFLMVMATITVITNRSKNRALMPWVTMVIAVVATFFLMLLNFVEQPFATGPMRPDGVGLNPQLKNYWMMIHPPCLYLGYVGFTVPFAFAISALATRRTGDLWFRTTRRWTLFAWFFLGIGILLGSYWAYVELGWGGYWAWDPVENASLMPWLVGTAFLHSVMIQEKKGMLKVWNMSLIILTFALSIFGTFLTRSGIISSVHSFATSGIGPWFFGGLLSRVSGGGPWFLRPWFVIFLGVVFFGSSLVQLILWIRRGRLDGLVGLVFLGSLALLAGFLPLVFFGSLVLLILRLDHLKSEARLESALSRESSFLFNNLILVGIAATVLLLTTFPMLSEAVTGRKVTMGPPIFNMVNIPWALLLLLLVGIGPLLAWRKATVGNLKRNFVFPSLVGLWMLTLVLIVGFGDYWRGLGALGAALVRLDVAGLFEELKTFYPPLTFGFGALVLATMALEFYRGARVRVHQHGQSWPAALGSLVWRNKRRYGGYTVHVGVVLIFFGIAGSSAYRKEAVQVLEPGQAMTVDPYVLRYDGYRLEALDDHIGAITELTVFRGGRKIGTLEAEQRMHPNLVFPELRQAFLRAKLLRGQDPEAYRQSVAGLYPLIQRLEQQARREVKTPSTEVGIHKSFSLAAPSSFGEDLYVIPTWIDPQTGQASLRVFVNPMVNFIWLGGLVFMLGAHICVLPDARERQRLRVAIALEEQERAVA